MIFNTTINDITTTYPNPPQYKVIAAQESKRNYVFNEKTLPEQKNNYDLGPLPIARNLEAAYALVDTIAKGQPRWEIIVSDRLNRRIEIVVTTPILRLKEDVVIEVRDNPAGGLNKTVGNQPDAGISWIHMRSKSRVKSIDFGTNAKRIQNFFEEIQAADSQH